ncbi:MAG: hypothetical protein LUE14_08030 [Clostridiales bacterium]|nr:hypothetical protein [Lachnospiraceae bacterium]MCD8110033.1 hypothetical protein [Clostridiales bacterium]
MIRKNRKKVSVPVLILSFLIVLSGCGSIRTEIESAADGLQEILTADSAPTGETMPEVDSVSEGKYAYGTLDDETKQVYDEIVYAFSNRITVTSSTTDTNVMEQAYQAVRYDYCDFFWIESLSYVKYSREDEITALEIAPTYSMTEEEQEAMQQQIDAEAERMLADAPADGSDFDKALYVYETLIREVDYVVGAENSQNIISAFVNHETVCQGYAYATQYLLEKLGVACTTVLGSANGETHAWNLVVMDGFYYYIDTTWGNSQFVYRSEDGEELSEEDILRFQYMDYDYFGVTTEMLLTTHAPDAGINLPVCTATADNYYVHKGLYVDVWDADAVGAIIRSGYENGDEVVRIRFSDMELCEQAVRYFLTDGHVFDYCYGLESVQYLQEADSTVMVLVL